MRATSINLSFSLLFDFARDKNKFAPVIYKALTFMLIDGYHNHEIREEMMKNFVTLFTQYQNIPINILCEPLLKLIQINLHKETNSGDGLHSTQILRPSSDIFNLNTTDF